MVSNDYEPLLHRLSDQAAFSTQAASLQTYSHDWQQQVLGVADAVVFPATIEDVSHVVRFCAERQKPLVPSGGRTGLSGGAVAQEGDLVLSLEKLNTIHSIGRVDRIMYTQAGVITAQAREAAQAYELDLPITFSSEGSSHIGGNIATHAGGMHVVYYGPLRNYVLGLRVVLPSGEVCTFNGPLVKNQTGYDLTRLFIGSEGTLGVIVEAWVQLVRKEAAGVRVLLQLGETNDALPAFEHAQSLSPLRLCEYLSAAAVAKIAAYSEISFPFSSLNHDCLLIEFASQSSEDTVSDWLERLWEEGHIQDAVMGSSHRQNVELLALRDNLSELLSSRHEVYRNDISLPVGGLRNSLSELQGVLQQFHEPENIILYGHVGDGNIHVNLLKPAEEEKQRFAERCKKSDASLFPWLQKKKGAVSAEHGIGLLKKEALPYTRSETELKIMRSIKKAIDPQNIMNPGKIFDLSETSSG